MSEEFIPVAEVAEVPPGRSKVIRVSGKAIALFNVEGAIYAMENRCPHEGGPVGDGEFVGTTITCPSHQWRFDVRTGACSHDASILAKTYDVRIEDGMILVDASRLLTLTRRNREILRRTIAGESPEVIGRVFHLSPSEVERIARLTRIGERLLYFGELYLRKGRVGGGDLPTLPYRDVKPIDNDILEALDRLTRLL